MHSQPVQPQRASAGGGGWWGYYSTCSSSEELRTWLVRVRSSTVAIVWSWSVEAQARSIAFLSMHINKEFFFVFEIRDYFTITKTTTFEKYLQSQHVDHDAKITKLFIFLLPLLTPTTHTTSLL